MTAEVREWQWGAVLTHEADVHGCDRENKWYGRCEAGVQAVMGPKGGGHGVNGCEEWGECVGGHGELTVQLTLVLKGTVVAGRGWLVVVVGGIDVGVGGFRAGGSLMAALLAWDGDNGNDGDGEYNFPVSLGISCQSFIPLGNPAAEALFIPLTLREVICTGDAVLHRLLAGSYWTKLFGRQNQGL